MKEKKGKTMGSFSGIIQVIAAVNIASMLMNKDPLVGPKVSNKTTTKQGRQLGARKVGTYAPIPTRHGDYGHYGNEYYDVNPLPPVSEGRRTMPEYYRPSGSNPYMTDTPDYTYSPVMNGQAYNQSAQESTMDIISDYDGEVYEFTEEDNQRFAEEMINDFKSEFNR